MKRIVTIVFFLFIVVSSIFFFRWINNKNAYSFFVAGHLYGHTSGNSVHIHPPFKASLPYIQSIPGMAFGVFTGDLVRKPEQKNFDTLVIELATLEMPYYIAPGNHDVGNRKLYEQFFGDHQNDNKTYRSFVKNDDLFIILDGNLNRESIVGDQLVFLKENLEQFATKSRNIFVFIHQLIWWSKDNEFKNIATNWPPNTPNSNNYWAEIEPLLVSSNKPVFLFAGDLGANHLAAPFMYYQKNNIRYVASGMGHMKEDNFIIVHLSEEGKVNLELVALQGEKNSLGKLEDYQLPLD